MNLVNISYKEMAKLLGVSVSEARRIHNSLIEKGYIKKTKDGSTFQLTIPDEDTTVQMPCSPIKYAS